MKRLFTLLMLGSAFFATAQQNPGLKLTFNGKQITNISASFGAIMDYDVPLCADIVPVLSKGNTVPPYAAGQTATAITQAEGCDEILNAADLSGKIALIRRGTCEFGNKALRAQEAGAIAVIIYNRPDPANADGPIAMGPGADGGNVTIPATMIGLADAEAVITAYKAGTKTTGCFTRPGKLIDAVYANPWGNVTPLSQVVDSIAPSFQYINRKDSLSNVVSVCEITSPSGIKTVLSNTHELGVTEEGFVSIVPTQGYLPTEKGKYKCRFFGTFSPTDTVTSEFIISDYTFANDLLEIQAGGVTRTPATFAATDSKISNILNYYATSTNATATYASFGLKNAAKLKGRTVDISLLRSDSDRLGSITSTTVNPSDIGDLVGDVLTYTINGNEDPNKLITLGLRDGAKKGIALDENIPYILVFQYDGTSYPDSIAPEWSLGRTVATRWPGIGTVNGTALMTGASYFGGGWSDDQDPIGRLHIDSYVGTKNIVALEEDEVKVFPNPTTSVVNVQLNLKEAAKTVQLGIMDFTGRLINTYDLNVQNGVVPVNISNYPAGTYFFTIKTDKAFTTEKVIKQ